jgi:hypothetical protein
MPITCRLSRRKTPRQSGRIRRYHPRAQTPEANIEIVRGWCLTEAQLALPGRHPELGPVNMKELLAAWVVHDLNHIAQIARVMAKQYAGEVGAWRAYLSILNR